MGYVAAALGLFIFILAFFTLNAPLSNNEQKIKVEAKTQYCEKADPATAPTFQAPADNVLKVGSDDVDESAGTLVRDPEGCGGTRHQLSDNNVTYRLIRKNVPLSMTDVKKHDYNWDDSSCHFDTAEKLGIDIPEVDKTKYKVFYPEISGELSLDRMLYSRTRQDERTLMYLIDYGLVVLLHLNPDGSITELKGGTTDGKAESFALVDVYQDIDSNRPELPEEALSCDTTRGEYNKNTAQVFQPNPATSPDPDQLQLRHFVFGAGESAGQVVNGWGIHCKPAVYLYPPRQQIVNVQVNPRGQLSYTDPPYDKTTGWTVWAKPDGKISNFQARSRELRSYPIPNFQYDYLYYESKLLDSEIKKPESGWVVKPDQLESLFNKILPELGLNKKEQSDFMGYWLNKLPASPYYFVGLVDKPQRDYLEALKVTPDPDTSIRFSLYFEALDQPKVVTEPKITTPTRKGFTLVDWGGMVKLHPGTPFTCSQ